MNTSLTTGGMGDFLKRSIMVFGFWFFIGGVMAAAYSELVTRIYTMRDIDDPEDPLDLEERRLVPHQVLGFAITFATGVLFSRIMLEFLCSNKWACAVVSGHAHTGGSAANEDVEDAEEMGEDDGQADYDGQQQQQQPPPQMQQQMQQQPQMQQPPFAPQQPQQQQQVARLPPYPQ